MILFHLTEDWMPSDGISAETDINTEQGEYYTA